MSNLRYLFRIFLGHTITRLLRLDWMLLIIVVAISTIGFIALFSAGYSMPERVDAQLRNLLLAALSIVVVTLVPVRVYKNFSPYIYILGCILLVLTLVMGVTVKGATRWIAIGGGLRIQPSEILKLATPLMLAWFYSKREESISLLDHIGAFLILLIPMALIIKQPDLGTSLMVAAAGFAVIFLAGLDKRIIYFGMGALIAALPIIWTFLHDYQRERVLTLLDPSRDPLGKGFHIIQAVIAIGSGGFSGKGWMEGTQAHLDFIPEKTSDFLFAVYSEEFGFVGNLILIVLYALLIGRSFYIASVAPTRFSRLLAGSIGSIFFAYSFVNMGMVSGILPVVGVPLPFMSYGGTALIILGIGTGMLLSISAESRQKFLGSS